MQSPVVPQLFRPGTPQPITHPAAPFVPLAPRAVPADARNKPRGQTPWPAARLALTNRLWGSGFIFPGGEAETLRLAKPLGTSTEASVLLLGVGSGGPASVVTRNLGAWVTGLDSDASLLAAARGLISRAQLGKKVTLDSWNPANPVFADRSHHHCLALEPLRGERPEPILYGLARALRPNGKLVITELVVDAPLNDDDPTVVRWADLEKRSPGSLVTGVAITRTLGRVGLDVRSSEDISDRHLDQAMLGWKLLVRDLAQQKPDSQLAALLVSEAELWLLRRRLMQQGRLRMMRWHAINRALVN